MIDLLSPVTLALVITNTLFTLWVFYLRPEYFEPLAEWPYQIVHQKKFYQMFTSAFLHVNFMHLLFNMFALFTFGIVLENLFGELFGSTILGSLVFALIYFVSLICGSVLTLISHRNDPNYSAVGASGAVSGIVFCYVIFFPTSTIAVFFIPMPAYLFAILYVGFSIYGIKSRLGNLGHEAHLGGAIGGVIATLILVEEARTQIMKFIS